MMAPGDDQTGNDQTGDLARRVRALAAAAQAVDGVAPLSEAFLLGLDEPAGERHHLTRRGATGLAGYAQVDPTGTCELVVHPDARRAGRARSLWTRALALGARTVWAHGDLPSAAGAAASFGLDRVRELHRMGRALSARDRQAVTLPEGFSVRTFEPDADDEAWVALNALAFAAHPEQGRLTVADLHARMALDWFDPAGFFLVVDDGDPDRGPIAFHWTKATEDRERGWTGEVYVVGVHPAYRGRGLARPLTRLGIAHLAGRGLPLVELYVDGDNAAALATYRKEGFNSVAVDVMYAVPAPPPEAAGP